MINSVTHKIDTSYLNTPVEFYPPKYSKKEYRENIANLANHLIDTKKGLEGEEANAVNPLKHTYGDGLYIREIFMPK